MPLLADMVERGMTHAILEVSSVALEQDRVAGHLARATSDWAAALGTATSLLARARALGANAVVGVDLDYEVVGQSMLMVSASGTAVVIG